MSAYTPIQRQPLTLAETVDQFLAAMLEQGIETTDEIEADGKLHRFHVVGDTRGSRNGFYCLHADDRPAGIFGCNKRYGADHKFQWQSTSKSAPWTEEERQAYRERVAKERAAKDAVEKARHEAAAVAANDLWNASPEATDDHPYLKSKGVKAHGLRVGRWEKINKETGEVRLISDNALLVPIYDKHLKIHSLQAIFPSKLAIMGNRNKDYMADGAKRGFFHTIGAKPLTHEGKPVFVLCEGYATGASIHEATGHRVLVSFDAGNLQAVAQSMMESAKSRGVEYITMIAADNDRWTTEPVENPGVHHAMTAAKAVGGLVVIPEFTDLDGKPTDFNDLHQREGVEVVSNAIEAALCGPATKREPECHPAAETLKLAGDTNGALAAIAEPAQPVAEFEEGLLPEPANENEPVSLVTANDNANIDVHDLQPVNPFEWPNLSSKSQPLNTIPNLRRLLDNYGFTVRYDVIRKDLVIRYPGQSGTQDNSRETAVNTVVSLCALNHLPKADAPGFLLNIGDANLVNPVMDFITSQPWDGRSRFNELIDTVQTREGYDRGLFAMLLRRWLISAVAAAAKPSGFWSKGVLVFQGEQSLGKTAWIRSLLPEGLRDLIKIDATINPDNKDTIISAVSHWICELGELDGTLRKADIARLKGFISQDVDQFRRPYARTEGKYGRRTVFFASVNPEQFLADDTGNVRWWTVPVTRVNSQHSIDMQQLWAEVFEWLKAGERWWLERDEEGALEIVNDNHRHVDPIEEIILGAYDCNATRDRKLAASDVLREIGFEKPTTGQSRTASKVLKAMFGEPRKSNGRLVFTMPFRIDGYYRRHDDEYPI